MVFHVPDDQTYNAAYGIVMMRQAQLDCIADDDPNTRGPVY
jgi:hypothetical protein